MLLNVLFMGTSHVVSHFPIQYWALYAFLTAKLAILFFSGDIQTFYDAASFMLTLTMVVLGYLAFRGDGARNTALKVLQLCSASFLPLGIEIFLFDTAEWNMNFASFQRQYGIFPGFTNQDLFVTVLSLLVASVALDRLSKSRGPFSEGLMSLIESGQRGHPRGKQSETKGRADDD